VVASALSSFWAILHVGFYVWNASHVTMSLGCILNAIGYVLEDESGWY
jgi:heme exporter protein D